jgi:hypothetical protein
LRPYFLFKVKKLLIEEIQLDNNAIKEYLAVKRKKGINRV